jgi:ferritin
MKTNRLSKTMSTALNVQLTNEAHASQIYLSFGAWAQKQGLNGVADFLFRHAAEERNHMMKFLDYVSKRGADVLVAAIPAPPEDPTSLNNCFEKILAHEEKNTAGIYKLVKMSFDESDWATWNFLQWFVKEQVEEETLVMNLLDKMKIAGGEHISNDALYIIDRDIQAKPDDSVAA